MKDYINFTLNDSDILIHESVFVSIAKEIINDETDFMEKGINVKQNDNDFILDIDLKVKKSDNLTDKCSKLQTRILEVTKQITDVQLQRINIRIIGFIF